MEGTEGKEGKEGRTDARTHPRTERNGKGRGEGEGRGGEGRTKEVPFRKRRIFVGTT